jgi:hypothetical protein
MKLAVLNPRGNDPDQPFPDFAGPVDDGIHAPVNYHAFAACTAGSFHRTTATVSAEQKNVLLLLRRDLNTSLKALRELKPAGKTVVVSWKESGLHQVAEQLNDARNIELFLEICALADGALSSTPDLLPVYRGAGAKHAEFIPTPYPVEDPRWDFSVAPAERNGVFIGTREFDVPSRNHLASLLAARQFGGRITVFNTGKRTDRKRLDACGVKNLNVIEGRLPYSEYLREVAQHKLVFQLDRSAVPGQVAGDALLCRVPCVGGDSATERLAFRDLCGHGRDTGELVALAARLLSDGKFYTAAVESALAAAREAVSFSVAADRLAGFFARIGVC